MRAGQVSTFACQYVFLRLRAGTRAVLFALAMLPLSSSAYLLDGTKWLRGEAVFYVSIPGLSASEISWNSAVIDALNDSIIIPLTGGVISKSSF